MVHGNKIPYRGGNILTGYKLKRKGQLKPSRRVAKREARGA